MKRLLLLLFIGVPLPAETPEAAEIMRRVAENLDRAQAARAAWVYDQDIFVRLKRANGKLAREESRRYIVAPGEKGTQRKLVNVEGKILDGKKESLYTEAGYRTKDADIDGALVDSFAREILWRQGGIPNTSWRPFESKELDKYSFKLEGEEHYRDYDVYKISFREEGEWEGEALIERNEYQPVLVTSAWTGRVPAAVIVGLGTNVKQIGAKITYQRFDKDVWFPVECGGELKLRVLFLYARTIAFSAKNSGFRKTDVQSSIEFDAGQAGSEAGSLRGVEKAQNYSTYLH
jgi:hypothetical protein